MPIDFYYAPYSPPCWSVLMVAEALDLELNLKIVKTSDGEHLTPEYLKMNPQHTVPTIVDNGFALWESRAIITYLVNKYGKGSPLYPEDPQARALVDQRLYFDISTLYQRYMDYLIPQMLEPADEAKLKKVEEALGFVETFLEGRQYIAGDNLTLADYSIAASVISFNSVGIDAFKTPRIKAWFERVKTVPGFSKSEEGAKLFGNVVKEMINKKSS
ncbi:hypothetical protein MSG28_007877 [Choristoneura fumiferana]|uniref:Uncharacterized protein n=1 Tax=Choristoneura fumiferana TaxID=7141 RepID=A0ACC0J939_CHOFU|nr:hypothetical protein MSG28_007877 [Choristoneura fumiferana]